MITPGLPTSPSKGIDDLHREFTQRGVDVTLNIEDKPWGTREFTLTTPDGHRIAFGQGLK